MTMTREEVIDTVYQAINHLNLMREPQDHLPCREDTRLYGRQGNLDSLSLVALVLDVEETIGERSGMMISLADERALAQSKTPFSDVGSFADYALTRLQEADA